jgi:A/G-specific adenine glycosylase
MPFERSASLPAGEALRAWYGPRRRRYAWRGSRDPYAVLVSEVMLQQTQASRVEPIFRSFLERYPTVVELAEATPADVLRAWGNLGYNRRALRLHEAARIVVREHGGRVPADPLVLRRLPGVGPYTATAVAAIAFGAPIAAVDVNVGRVVARARLGVEPDELARVVLLAEADGWVDRADPSAWNQAVMDLGREVCRPAPRCGACPLAPACSFRAAGRAGRSSRTPQGAFEGSSRQARGAVVAALREEDALSAAELTRVTGLDGGRLAPALEGLVRDGVVQRVRTRYRLPI